MNPEIESGSATRNLKSPASGLNASAWRAARSLLDQPRRFGAVLHKRPCGATVVDCGVECLGGLRAGCEMARACLAGLAEVSLQGPPADAAWLGPHVAVATDHPLLACLGSQYAGWRISGAKADGGFFAMGSGPMRLACGKEKLLQQFQLSDKSSVALGVLETSRLPSDTVCLQVAEDCGVAPRHLTLLVVRTGSLAGGVQIAARAIETALHKLHELEFDVATVRSGWATAPLPPTGRDDLQAIGWTNDAVLYGGDVWLWVDCDDDVLQDIGPRVPSGASPDHGRPFGVIFAEYGHDFYKVDPMLFSPARMTLASARTGHSFTFGATAPDVLRRSFGGAVN